MNNARKVFRRMWSWLNWGSVSACACRNCGRPLNTSVWIPHARVNIPTEHFPKKSSERYHYINLFGMWIRILLGVAAIFAFVWCLATGWSPIRMLDLRFSQLWLRISILWCGPLKFNRYFGGIYRLDLQGRILREAKNQHGNGRLTFRPWMLSRYVPPKRRLTFTTLLGVISRKI
jgi:hypothetical protein